MDDVKNPFKDRFEKKKRKKNVLLAILLLLPFCIATALWGEFYHVKRVRIHDTVSSQIVSLPSGETIDPSLDGKLVYISDTTSTPEKYFENFLLAYVDCIKFIRHVQYWQILNVEEYKVQKLADGRDTTVAESHYVYKWTESPAPVIYYKDAPESNKVLFNEKDTTYVSPAVKLGPYRLTDGLLPAFPEEELNPLPEYDSLTLFLSVFIDLFSKKTTISPSILHRDGNTVYVGKDPENPEVGDLFVDYKVVKNQPLSVIAKVSGDSLVTANLEKVPVTSSLSGLVPLEQILKDRKKEQAKLIWVLRFLAFILAFSAFMILTEKSSKMIFLKALVGAIGTVLVLMSVPWILYKWGIGVPLLLVGIGLLTLYVLMVSGVIKLEKKEPEVQFL